MVYSDIFIYTQARTIFGGFNIFLGFQNDEYFWGYEDFVDIFGGHHKIGLVFRLLSEQLRVLS